MKFNILKNYLIETYIVTARVNSGVAEFYLNESISQLSPGCRGVITTNGDLYTAKIVTLDDDVFQGSSLNIIHEDLLRFVSKKLGTKIDYEDFSKIINVQRDEETSNFYLGESYYLEDIEKIVKSKEANKIKEKFLRKNKDKNLIFKRINLK